MSETIYVVIDEKIAHWIKLINAFDFVETVFSCQGHYCRNIAESILYYYETDKSWDCCVADSRTKSPYVLLKFVGKKYRDVFVRIWLRCRRWFFANGIWLYYITEKNLESTTSFTTPSIILSKFGKINVSVSFVIDKAMGTRYYNNKKRYDDNIHKIRKEFFDRIARTLEVTQCLNETVSKTASG